VEDFVVELEQEEVLVLLAPAVSQVSVDGEDSLDLLGDLVYLDHKDSLDHRVSLAFRDLQDSSVDHRVSVVVQASRDSLVHLVTRDPRAAKEEQVLRERLVQKALLAVLVSTSCSNAKEIQQ